MGVGQSDPAMNDDLRSSLVEAELRLRELVEHALEAIVTVDENGSILEWNEQAERTFGWSRSEAVGSNAVEILVPGRYRDRTRDVEALNRPLEAVALHREGREVPVEVVVIPLFWRGHRIYTAFARDITDRIRAAAEARHVEAVVDAATNAVIGVALDGTILSWNRAAERMFGFETAEIRGSTLERILTAEDLQDTLEKVRNGVADDGPSLALRRDGSTCRVARALRPINDDAGHPIGAVLICNDVSAHVEQYLASLGRVASSVGHEFNNVLMGIQPFIDLIDRYATDRRLKEAAGHMRRSIQRGRQLTEEIRAFSRASAPTRVEPVPIREFVSALEKQARTLLKPGIDVQVHDPVENVAVICHLAQITQAVMNLILNAQDAMPAGGTLTLSFSREGDSEIEISVADNGTGMSDAIVSRIFEPLFTTKAKGTGLGLAITQHIVDRHGGSISVETKVGEGTVFRIRLRAVANR